MHTCLIILLFFLRNEGSSADERSENDVNMFVEKEAKRMSGTLAGFEVKHAISQRHLDYGSDRAAHTENKYASSPSLPRRLAKETNCPKHVHKNEFAIYSYNFGNFRNCSPNGIISIRLYYM